MVVVPAVFTRTSSGVKNGSAFISTRSSGLDSYTGKVLVLCSGYFIAGIISGTVGRNTTQIFTATFTYNIFS